MSSLPEFIIPGCAKGGTTSVYRVLQQHSQVYMATIKESYFLIGDQSRLGQGKGYTDPQLVDSLEAYRQLYTRPAGAGLAGEVCNAYLYLHEEAIPMIRRYLGDPKIVIILREPVSRTYSGYLHLIRENLVNETFETCLSNEPDRIRRGYWWGYHIQAVSRYAASVEAYMEAFSSVKVLFHEDLKAQPEAFFGDLFTHLELETPANLEPPRRENATGVPRSRALANLLQGQSRLKRIWQGTIPAGPRKSISALAWRWLLRKPLMNPATADSLGDLFGPDVARLDQIVPGTAEKWNYHDL